MTTGIVTCNLYRRKNKPSVNSEKADYFFSGDKIEIKDVVIGDPFDGVNTWYQLGEGIYVWSGGVSLNLGDPLFQKKIELDKNKTQPGVLKPYNPKNFWWIKDYGIDKIWGKGFTGKGVKIAVLDTGIQILHNDLNVNKNHLIDIVSHPDNTNSFIDPLNHGTHVFGLIAASNNGFGITGISYDSEMYLANIYDFSKGYSPINLAKAIDWAVGKKVDIISISQGDENGSSELRKSIENAISKNVLVVCSSGNSSDTIQNVVFPAKYSEELDVFSIGAIDKGRRKFNQSMEIGNISLYCPGVDLISCDQDLLKGYSVQSGTSQATPYFAGVASLILEFFKNKGQKKTPIQIGKLIIESADQSEFGQIINPLKLFESL